MVFSWLEAIENAERRCNHHLKIAQNQGNQNRIRELKKQLEHYAKHS